MELKYSNQFKVSANPDSGELVILFEQTRPIIDDRDPNIPAPQFLKVSSISTETVAPVVLTLENARQLKVLIDHALNAVNMQKQQAEE